MTSYSALELEELWQQLDQSVRTILTNLEAGFPYPRTMELYTIVYNYCAASRSEPTSKGATGAILLGEELYIRLQACLQSHLERIFRELSTIRDDVLLSTYLAAWSKYMRGVQLINHIFAYLNRFWVKRKQDEGAEEIHEIKTLALVQWRMYVFMPLKLRVRNCVLSAVAIDRAQAVADYATLRGVVESIVVIGLNNLQLYRTEIETPLLEAAQQHYIQQASVWVSTTTPSEYCTIVTVSLASESERVRLYLHRDTEPELLAKCEKVLIADHVDHISADFVQAMDGDRVEDVQRMYSLLARVKGSGLDGLRASFEQRVKTVGAEAIAAACPAIADDPQLFCDTLLRVLHRYGRVVADCFRSDAGFVAVLNKAARTFVNSNAVSTIGGSMRIPELIARQIDAMLRATTTEATADTALDGIMTLFRMLDDKDVFQKFYARRLASRLIGGLSASEDAESQMLARLKEVCGFEYTSKLQRMFTDMSVNRDLNEKFRRYHEREPSATLPIDFSVLVLATGSWPLQQMTTDTSLPVELDRSLAVFTAFYNQYFSGRRLHWLHHLSRGEVVFTPKRGVRFVLGTTSSYQITVLLQFNNETTRSYLELAEATKLSPLVLKSTLASLVRSRLFTCSSTNTDSDDAVFSLALDFKSKRARVMLAPVSLEPRTQQQQPQQSEDAPAQEEVQEDRRLQIQAAVVRIMKARKTLDHNALIMEVVTQLQTRFKASVAGIKRAIEQLIDKEYLERAADDKSRYVYKA
eukprot:TRINITY_DN188_c0_g1_i1.p1 TRINITY_DN188_c0_g1~~TRINITY_DN188_c0_g1_i1.p1  ORF type:complete len:752 (+),score=182.54 TRINITY_DN188_c0_g1_i1:100-2355(+)